tara:strand:- start:192 stop:461 length:270 start_codon:yes stop_codon:yes gene_type:complete
MFSKSYSNNVGCGNVFNNMRLHSVTSGSPRISYVLRLVHKNVKISKESVEIGIQRSNACKEFNNLLKLVPQEKVSASTIDWCLLKSGHE